MASNLLILDLWVVRNPKPSPGTALTESNKAQNTGLEREMTQGEKLVVPTTSSLPTPIVNPIDACGPICRNQISEEVSRAIATVSAKEKTEKVILREEASTNTNANNPTIIPVYEKAKNIWIPLVSSANTTNTNWTDVTPSDFYFDQEDYPGIKQVVFVAYLRAVDATGPVYARVYDVTNKRGVDNSEISTSSNSYQRFETTALSIWRGNNLYRLQLKSGIGTQVILSEAKLKVEW